MKSESLQYALPKHAGDYRFAWGFSFLIALASAPFVVYFKQTAPWLITVPLILGAVGILVYEWIASGYIEAGDSEIFVSLPSEFSGLKSYENMLALEIRPKRKEPKGQLSLFPGFVETTPANAIKSAVDEHGKSLDIIRCDRYSALLVTYLLEHLDDATEKSLAAGLVRFGSLNKQQSDIQSFVHDKGIREAIKADFRGNLVALVSKGGEKVLRDLLKTIEAKRLAADLEKKSTELEKMAAEKLHSTILLEEQRSKTSSTH